MTTIPTIKKKVNAFLLGEDGKISKKSIISAGFLLSVGAPIIMMPETVEAGHSSGYSLSENCADHSSHSSHGSHASHGSHSSHGQW